MIVSINSNKLIILICFFASFSFLSSCKSWEPIEMTNRENNKASKKLVNLKLNFQNIPLMTNDLLLNDERNILLKEFENNLMDLKSDFYGYLEINRNIIDSKPGLGYTIPSVLLFSVPNIFGMPFLDIKQTTEIEVKILDKDGKLIEKYSAIGKGNVKVAYYYGYSLRIANRKAYSDAIINALEQIRVKLEVDIDKINARLLKTGKINS